MRSSSRWCPYASSTSCVAGVGSLQQPHSPGHSQKQCSQRLKKSAIRSMNSSRSPGIKGNILRVNRMRQAPFVLVVIVLVMLMVPMVMAVALFAMVASKKLPCVGKIVFEVEEAPTLAREPALRGFAGRFAQPLAPFARRVVEMQNDVAQGLHGEVVVLLRQLESPPADCPVELERQIPCVVEAQLKKA